MGHLLTVEPQRSGNLQPLEFSRQAKPQAKNSRLQTFVVNSRSIFDGTVTATDMDRATDAREKGRIGIIGSAQAYAGSRGRVTSERIGRDLNPLGRGDGNAYVGGAQNYGRIYPTLPKSSAQPGWGNSVNNGCDDCPPFNLPPSENPPGDLPPNSPPTNGLPAYCPCFTAPCCIAFHEGIACCGPPECKRPDVGYTTACSDDLNEECELYIKRVRSGEFGYSTDGTPDTCQPGNGGSPSCKFWIESALYNWNIQTLLSKCLPLIKDPELRKCLIEGMKLLKSKENVENRICFCFGPNTPITCPEFYHDCYLCEKEPEKCGYENDGFITICCQNYDTCANLHGRINWECNLIDTLLHEAAHLGGCQHSPGENIWGGGFTEFARCMCGEIYL